MPHIYYMSVKRPILRLATLMVLFQMGCMGGCSSSKQNIIKADYPNEKMPFASFVRVTATHAIQACQTITDKDGNKGERCTVGAVKYTSSGAIVGHSDVDPTVAYALTAGHSCEEKIKKAKVDGFTLSTVASTYVTLSYKGILKSAEIVAYDMAADVCILKVKGYRPSQRPKIVPISKKMPKMGEKVYNPAAPRGIFGPGMLLMFDGYYAGVGFRNYMFFSIPTKPGSSGSPILNEKGELVSMIFAGFPAMENIGLGSNLNNIRTFVVDTIVASEMDSWAKKNMNRDTTETMTTEPPKP
jgi:hypothetical protein